MQKSLEYHWQLHHNILAIITIKLCPRLENYLPQCKSTTKSKIRCIFAAHQSDLIMINKNKNKSHLLFSVFCTDKPKYPGRDQWFQFRTNHTGQSKFVYLLMNEKRSHQRKTALIQRCGDGDFYVQLVERASQLNISRNRARGWL